MSRRRQNGPDGERALRDRSFPKEVFLVLLLSAVALLVHGYHLGIEDEAIYLPAIKQHLDPGLYPFDSPFFQAQTKFTLYDEMIALLVRATAVPVNFVLFGFHFLSIFLVLLGCFLISRECFRDRCAQWASVALVAALLTIPVTGTALYILDQHLHPRSLSTAAVLFVIVCVLKRRYAPAALFSLAGAAIHPQMMFYGLMFAVLLALRLPGPARADSGGVAAAGIGYAMSPETWDRIASTRMHHYPLKWPWYEWLGIVGPLALLYWFGTLRPKGDPPAFPRMCRRLAAFGALNALAAVALTAGPYFQGLANLQPMRGYQLVYLLFFLMAGGLIGERVLKNKPIRWMVLFLPLCLGMFAAQRAEFAGSPHIELPGAASGNPWIQTFDWIRRNTPRDAYFALDPYYMRSPGEDYHGFRALAERSAMADFTKDVAVVALSVTAQKIGAAGGARSDLPRVWSDHMRDLAGWKDFTVEDFKKLKEKYGVGWVVLEKPCVDGLPCPFENSRLKVCRIP